MATSKRRTSRGSGITLPWEQRGNLLRQLVSGRRWKGGLAILLLLGVAALFARSADSRNRERDTRLAIAEVRRAVGQFKAQVGRCPRTTTELVHPPRARTRYLRAMPKDGWDRQLRLSCPGHDDPDGFDVISAGPSGDFFIDDNMY